MAPGGSVDWPAAVQPSATQLPTHSPGPRDQPDRRRPTAWAALASGLLCCCCALGGCERPASDSAGRASSRHGPAELARRLAFRQQLRDELGAAYDEPLAFDGSVRYDRGRQLYELLCQGCHGPDGRGDGPVSAQLSVPPGDLTDPVQAAFWSDRARLEIVRRGSPGTPMLGWAETLGEPDLAALYKFVSHLVPEQEPR